MCYGSKMVKKGAVIRVIFNDAHANLSTNSYIPQGGVSSFANKFSKYFDDKTSNIELVSLLFSHNSDSKDIYIKETAKNHKYYELYYPKEKLIKSYKKTYTRKDYIKFLEPWLKQVDHIFEETKPEIVFLNGFSLSNWLILEIAHRRKVPICIQHAGIWKKELSISQKSFSPSIRKIFSRFEKEIFSKASKLIFLNEFSRDVFFTIHNIKKNIKNLSKTLIIPLPIDTKNFKNINITKRKIYNIGIVARWDGVKNHDAILRLAKYIKKNNLPIYLKVVTGWGSNKITEYKKEYMKFVKILNPMSPEKLREFYDSQDIIIIPSRFDVSPTVLMEAISCGKPVIISSNVGWVSDYKKFNLDKLIISPIDSGENIFNTIKELTDNKEIYINRFKKMQRKIISKNNTKKVFEIYNNVFKELSK